MTELYSRYISGAIFPAGHMIGSYDGVSGINPIVDRLNSITTDGNLITGSMISGANIQIYSMGVLPSGVRSKIFQVYTGSGFDSIKTSAGTDEQSHELDTIGSIYTSGISYMKVGVTGQSKWGTEGTTNGTVQIKVQSRETGETYSDSLTYKIIAGGGPMESGDLDESILYSTFQHYHPLTVAEQASGIQFKVWSKSTNVYNRENSFTNYQTVVSY